MIHRLLNALFVIFPALFFLMFGIWVFAIPDAPLPFTSVVVEHEKREIDGMVKAIKATEQANGSLSAELKPMFQMRDTACRESEEKADGIFRERIETASMESGAKLRSMGQTRKTVINDETVIYELPLAIADCKIDALSSFLEDLSRKNPCIYLKSFSIAPDSASKPETLSISGTVCMICFIKEKKD